MGLFKLTVTKDHAWQVTRAIGEQGKCHFLDLNLGAHPMSLPFTNTVKQCKAIQVLLSKLESLSPQQRGLKAEEFRRVLHLVSLEKNLSQGQPLLDSIQSELATKLKFIQQQHSQLE